jgi:hypothetical protein
MDLKPNYQALGKFIYGSVRVQRELEGLLGVAGGQEQDLKAEFSLLADRAATKARDAALAPGAALAYATLSDHLGYMASLHDGLPESIDSATPQRLHDYATAAETASQLIAGCRA